MGRGGGLERERRDPAQLVAARAAVGEDRRDVALEAGRLRALRERRCASEDADADDDPEPGRGEQPPALPARLALVAHRPPYRSQADAAPSRYTADGAPVPDRASPAGCS